MRLADGVELIGKYEGSGFKKEPYLVRRADGQVVQLPELLYLVLEEMDGGDPDAIAERVSERFGRGLDGDGVLQLAEKLAPLGVLAGASAEAPQQQAADPMLALKFKVAVIPPHAVRAITNVFRPLFLPAIVTAVVGGLLAVDAWLFFSHGIAGSVRQVVYQPVLVVLILGLLTLSAAFHEIGHATACRYGGASPGAMGAGIYVVWPAFYTDVTDAYRLDRRGRLRTDLGGIYFNAIFILATVGAYAVTGYEPLLLLVPVQHFQMLFQLMPMLRLDGYYVISDLTGVPDMLGRVKPILRSFAPWQETEAAVTDLKPWARAVVTLYVLVTVPALLLAFGLMLLNLPRVAATGYDSFFVQLDRVRGASSGFSMGIGAVQLLILVLPVVGMALTTTRVTRRVGGAAWTATDGRPLLRMSFLGGATGLIGILAFTWWPNGEYRPIQPGERGTVQGGIRQLSSVMTGRPSLTPQRAHDLGGAPNRRDYITPSGKELPSTHVTTTPSGRVVTTPVSPPGPEPVTPSSDTGVDDSTPSDSSTPTDDGTSTEPASTDTTSTDTTATDTTSTDGTYTDTTSTDTTFTDTTAGGSP